VFHEQAMKIGSAHAEATTGWKSRFDHALIFAEPNAGKRMRRHAIERNAERAGGGHAIGHNAFPACFANGRNGVIRKGDVESTAARGDGSGKARRAAAHYEHIGRSRCQQV
jgi:hypothetical protein